MYTSLEVRLQNFHYQSAKIETPQGASPAGFFHVPTLAPRTTFRTPIMHPDTLQRLRCPLDPDRVATLTHDREIMMCDRCHVIYPVKQGLPVLIAAEAELPPGCDTVARLPCQRNRQK